jgi:hypothetical protein
MLYSVKTTRTKDPRPTLAAFGAPLPVTPRREMALEEAVARALVAARRDPTLALVLTVVLLDNALDGEALLAAAKARKVEPEAGMFLALAARVGRRPALARLARRFPKHTGKPRYYPAPLGGRFGRALADQNTPPVVAAWGFRMNETEADLRGFVEKHLG